jgi:hypothetical protein
MDVILLGAADLGREERECVWLWKSRGEVVLREGRSAAL